jgi:hypothetical protein
VIEAAAGAVCKPVIRYLQAATITDLECPLIVYADLDDLGYVQDTCKNRS